MARKHLKPQLYDDDDDLEAYLKQNKDISDQESDDEFAKLSFGSLKTAQSKLDKEESLDKKSSKKPLKKVKPELRKVEKTKKEPVKKYQEPEESDDQIGGDAIDSDDSEGFFDNESDSEDENQQSNGARYNKDGSKKKGKHAPKETSSKKKVSRIRTIPGLAPSKQQSSLYQDIRFDTAFGKADAERARKDYKFLDEYRQKEVDEINSIIKNPKLKSKLEQYEIEELEYRSKSLRSRLESLKNRDLQKQVLQKYKDEHKGQNKFYLKDSEKKKILQKFKFDNMKASQREKVVERKRKRRLGKEFKQLEFNRPRN